MKIKLFEKEKHYDMVAHWWEQQLKSTPQPADIFPPTGLVIFDDEGNGLVAGFLIKTDTVFCLLDHFIANPEIEKPKRNEALDLLIKALDAKSITLGFRVAILLSKTERLRKRFLQNNYEILFESLHILRKEL